MVDEYKYSGNRLTQNQVNELDKLRNLQEKVERSGKFDIKNIPQIMDHNNYYIGAKLMRKWFSGPANNLPSIGVPSTDVIKMEWVLGFHRAKSIYDNILKEKIWSNNPAKKEIIKFLKRKRLLTNKKEKFGSYVVNPTFVNKDYVQYRIVGGRVDMLLGPMDDLRAALANFSFRLIVLGIVEPIFKKGVPAKRYRVTINSVGVYVYDSYDFNDIKGDDQPLGYWNFSSKTTGRFPLGEIDSGFKGKYINNSDFRDWREKFNAGGDFLVYSDILYRKLYPADIFEFDE